MSTVSFINMWYFDFDDLGDVALVYYSVVFLISHVSSARECPILGIGLSQYIA